MEKHTGKFPSSGGLCDVRFYIYTPKSPRAAVMLSHGMCEYIERYEEFAEFLCEHGIALAGNDHIGHGSSLANGEMLGFFGQERGYVDMVRDLHRMKRVVNETFPDIPHFLMAHSMGSFLARIYLSKYRDRWNGAVIMGTAGGIAGSVPLRKLLDVLERDRGDYYRPDVGAKMFELFNIRVPDRRTPSDWLSRDNDDVDGFLADPKCNFAFTVAGYRDMLDSLLCANSAPVIENTPTNIPFLFLSGSMDPIGQYGKGVRKAVAKYVKHGCDVNIRLYNGARHELIFELNRDEVKRDILDFLEKLI
ncbi:MAG: lysophospholipase [Oscillospiraceae bacterium]|nr:lysophospholipase [Oscillospiraceae bacterium]